MNKLFIKLLILLLITSYKANSQTIVPVDNWMDYLESMATDTENQQQAETLFAELSYLTEHPFNINLVTADDLQRLPFLTDKQIEELCNYREKYGQFVSLYELKQLVSFDFTTIGLILPFVYIEDQKDNQFNGKKRKEYGKSEIHLRYDQGFQQKKGYMNYPDSVLDASPNKKYIGEPYYHSLRYSYSHGSNIQLGVLGEKDAGEPFLTNGRKGYDYYSAHLLIKEIGVLKSLAIGDYKVSFGQGLVISNDFSPSRSSQVLQTKRRTNGFRRHFSTNETDFFRGVASTITLNKVDLSFFYSQRKLDATADSMLITSFKTDGLHRLPRENDKKGTVSTHTTGGNIRYATPPFSVGFTVVGYYFGDKRIEPEQKPYNVFAFRGNSAMNMSVDYQLKIKKVTFYGETALSQNGALATLHGLQLSPASYISWLVSHRYYDKRYQAFYGNAFGQNSSVQNEQGVYLGMQLFPEASWRLSMYADFFSFPWLKYSVNTPSSGKEYMAEAVYTPRNKLSLSIRYQQKETESTQINRRQRLRLQTIYAPSSALTLRTTLNGTLYSNFPEESLGWMISQSLGFKPSSFPFQLDGYLSYFDTDDYYSRITSYEKNLLYSFSMPSYYGKGLRVSLSFKAEIVKKLSFSAKIGWAHYYDRELIGSDLEEISGKNKMDLNTLICWKF
jgi:hypothetical protein